MHIREMMMGTALIVSLAACQTAKEAAMESGAKPITADQWKSMFMGNTATAIGTTGNTLFVYYGTKGAMELVSGDFKDSGRWTTEGGMVCAQWKTIRGGAKACHQVFKTGDTYKMFDADGSLVATIKEIKKGKQI